MRGGEGGWVEGWEEGREGEIRGSHCLTEHVYSR